MTRIFIYEALALILTSGLIGSVVGISVALAITVQMVTFIELPLVFLFPTEIFFITFIEGILMAIIASYCAASKIKDKSISDIIKGIN